ncbi:MAG: methylated-DNA--[protein]-cysteine S-methyltransferase [Planctomycetota bacterium]|nr:MAG: methylated-DNA--[protein]-cysteine S-methyltransferase [Planctomycetota bacterium]
MPPLRYEVAETGRGRFRFGSEAGGALVSLDLPGRWRPRGDETPARPAWARWLRSYLAGGSPSFPGRWRLPGDSGFFRRVYRCVAAVPGGRTLSYAGVARRCGSPGAARAVGNAMARNPLPLIVPCHRVVAESGLGGYGGGLDFKRALLAAEKAHAYARSPAKRPAVKSK